MHSSRDSGLAPTTPCWTTTPVGCLLILIKLYLLVLVKCDFVQVGAVLQKGRVSYGREM